jgi:DNA-binding transcriptional regulator YhcF (GntR family)
MSVNTHTVLKAYEFLQSHDIIYPQRGTGFYLSGDAKQRVEATRKEEFFQERLPELFAEMKMLGINIDDVVAHWNRNL